MSSLRGKVEVSVEEAIATLSRSSLPTIVVEGTDDILVYRELETYHNGSFLSVFPVGGRDAVLSLFDSRSAMESGTVLFIADQDSWVIQGIPEPYHHPDLLLSNGYSIENDVIRDGNLINLMSASEKESFASELDRFIVWYTVAFHSFCEDQNERIAIHPNEVFNRAGLVTSSANDIAHSETLRDLQAIILADPFRLIRGKSLLNLIMRHLSYTGRSVRHNGRALMEMVGSNRGVVLNDLFDRVGSRLNNRAI